MFAVVMTLLTYALLYAIYLRVTGQVEVFFMLWSCVFSYIKPTLKFLLFGFPVVVF